MGRRYSYEIYTGFPYNTIVFIFIIKYKDNSISHEYRILYGGIIC